MSTEDDMRVKFYIALSDYYEAEALRWRECAFGAMKVFGGECQTEREAAFFAHMRGCLKPTAQL